MEHRKESDIGNGIENNEKNKQIELFRSKLTFLKSFFKELQGDFSGDRKTKDFFRSIFTPFLVRNLRYNEIFKYFYDENFISRIEKLLRSQEYKEIDELVSFDFLKNFSEGVDKLKELINIQVLSEKFRDTDPKEQILLSSLIKEKQNDLREIINKYFYLKDSNQIELDKIRENLEVLYKDLVETKDELLLFKKGEVSSSDNEFKELGDKYRKNTEKIQANIKKASIFYLNTKEENVPELKRMETEEDYYGFVESIKQKVKENAKQNGFNVMLDEVALSTRSTK